MAVTTNCSDFRAQKCSLSLFPLSPHRLPGSDVTRYLDLSFWKLSLASFFTLLFHLHQEALSSSSLSAIRMVSFAYLRLLLFFPAILIPDCASYSPEFHYVLCKEIEKAEWQYTSLTYSFPNFETVYFSMSSFDCCFLAHIKVSEETSKVFQSL